ncbi:MAG: hypothetical protein WDN06_01120 [Asticcacaulis sp.]
MGLFLLGVAGLAMAACTPKPQQAQDDDSYMRAKGYARAPQITVVAGSGGTVTVSGLALPGGRVRFLYGADRAIGVTADSKGRFKADLPTTAQGGLYDISMEDTGRQVEADGRLFVPPAAPQKAVILRAGAPSRPVAHPGPGITLVDYDAAGAMLVTGVAAPQAAIAIEVDGVSWPKQPRAAADGAFTATCQIPPLEDTAVTLDITVAAGSETWNRTIAVSRSPSGGDRITAVNGGWRVDWVLPGDGMQTTLVF